MQETFLMHSLLSMKYMIILWHELLFKVIAVELQLFSVALLIDLYDCYG